jgi:hypothetical protein
MRGVPLKMVQELTGHATIEMTMRYPHLSPHIPLPARGREAARSRRPFGQRLGKNRKQAPK